MAADDRDATAVGNASNKYFKLIFKHYVYF